MNDDISEDTLRNLIWKGYQRMGKPRHMAQEVCASREELALATGVPIDVCLVNEQVLETLPRMEGVVYLGRRYMRKNEWYLGNLASAQ